MKLRALITGASGFVGGHLTEALLEMGVDVVGANRHPNWTDLWRHLGGRVSLRTPDWLSVESVQNMLEEIRPDWLFHLAAYANAGASFREPEAAWAGNLVLTQTIYEAVVRWGEPCRILFVSSGMVYGESDFPDLPSDERTTLKPASPYATSKAAADLLSYQMVRSAGLDIVRVRPFNQIGPRQSPEYAAANFARQLVMIERNEQPRLVETGDLSGRRDIMDVRDVVQAYIRLMEVADAGEVFNIGSGTTITMKNVLDLLVSNTKVAVEIRQKLDPARSAEPTIMRADIHKIQAATGWSPKIPLEQTLADMMDDWRRRLAGGWCGRASA